MPLELLQDSDSSLATIGPHWPSSYPEYLSPYQGKDEQQRIVWARLISQRSNLAKSLREQKERYQALRRELNPRMAQVESSHDLLYRDTQKAGNVFEEGDFLSLLQLVAPHATSTWIFSCLKQLLRDTRKPDKNLLWIWGNTLQNILLQLMKWL